MSRDEDERAAREALEAQVAKFRSTRRPQKKWPYVVLVGFMLAGGTGVILLANYHSHSPFCNVAWDAWMTVDKFRAGQMSNPDAVQHLENDIASMEFHLDALRREGETKSATNYAAVLADVSALQSIVDSGRRPDYSTFAAKDLSVALTTAGCRGFAPH